MKDRLTAVGICGDNQVCLGVSRAFEEGSWDVPLLK